MATHHDASKRFEATLPDLTEAVDKALASMLAYAIHWSPDRRQVFAQTIMNHKSWGERLTVSLDEDGTVRVTSVCAFPLQILDWGKNRDNCGKLFDRIKNYLSKGRE